MSSTRPVGVNLHNLNIKKAILQSTALGHLLYWLLAHHVLSTFSQYYFALNDFNSARVAGTFTLPDLILFVQLVTAASIAALFGTSGFIGAKPTPFSAKP